MTRARKTTALHPSIQNYFLCPHHSRRDPRSILEDGRRRRIPGVIVTHASRRLRGRHGVCLRDRRYWSSALQMDSAEVVMQGEKSVPFEIPDSYPIRMLRCIVGQSSRHGQNSPTDSLVATPPPRHYPGPKGIFPPPPDAPS